MTLTSSRAPKNDDTETKSTPTQAAASSENAEAAQDEAQKEKKGKHGVDFCCGSCS